VLNLSLIILQPVPPLSDYKVWIDTERGAKVKCYLYSMAELNMMEEEFRGRRMEERWCAALFARQREMGREEYKEKQEQETARKHEKARHEKEAYEQGGDEVLRKAKWPSLTQN
jgi:hypothetical protein